MESTTLGSVGTAKFEPSSSQVYAKGIMGENFFGVEHAMKYFGIVPTIQEFGELYEVPFSKEKLESVKNDYLLVATFWLSRAEINTRTHGKELSCSPDLYKKDLLEKNRPLAMWLLFRKTMAPDSINKTWYQQMMAARDDIPTDFALIYAVIGHHLATGERLFEKCFVRTSSIGPKKNTHVDIGPFGPHGLGVSYNQDERISPIYGVSSFREP